MTEFEKLKNSYISSVQAGMILGVDYNGCRRAIDVLHKIYENLIDNSNCIEIDKMIMKYELELIKEALSEEIKSYYKKK